MVYKGKKYINYGVVIVVVWFINVLLSDVWIEMLVLNYCEEYGMYFFYFVVVGCDGVVE